MLPEPTRTMFRRTRIPAAALTLMCVLAAANGCDRTQPRAYIRMDGPAPQLLDAPRTRASLIAFWASWCLPCREETPELRALASDPPLELSVVVVSHDETMESVEQFFGGAPDAAFNLRIDHGRALADALNVTSLPVSILIVDGRLVARFEGSRRWNAASERRLLTKLIREHS